MAGGGVGGRDQLPVRRVRSCVQGTRERGAEGAVRGRGRGQSRARAGGGRRELHRAGVGQRQAGGGEGRRGLIREGGAEHGGRRLWVVLGAEVLPRRRAGGVPEAAPQRLQELGRAHFVAAPLAEDPPDQRR